MTQNQRGEFNMKRRILSAGLIAILIGFQLSALAADHRNGKGIRLIVRIENISDKDGFTASNGAKFPFALSPGMWVVHNKLDVRLLKPGVKASVNGLEMQAEDGNPEGLINYLERYHSHMLHGVFNTPVGASAPGPIGPGGAYEFTINAEPGMKLSLVTMFGQSNDWFYAFDNDGIHLFDGNKPISGDFTSKLILWNAGSEKDEEPGIGPNQGPRQKAPNTGEDEGGVVHKVKASAFSNKTADLLRVTITPEEKM
jgi:hypothetical protein